jgi:hypothetical protein
MWVLGSVEVEAAVRVGRALALPALKPWVAPLTFFLHLLHSFADLGFKYFSLIGCHCSPHWYHWG